MKNSFENNSDYVCPCCQIEEVLDDLLEQHGQFIEVIESNIFVQEFLPVIDILEDCFTNLNRAKVKLLQVSGNEVFLVENKIEYLTQEELLEE